MGLLQGSVSLRRFLVLGVVPNTEELNTSLERDRYRPFEGGEEEERCGWTDWRNPLVTPPDPNWMSQDRFTIFSMRVDTRKVPPTLLKAHLDLRIQQLMKEKDLAFIEREARISIQDEVKAELLRKVLPTIRSVDVAWDIKKGVLWTTASNTKAQSLLTNLFRKSFNVELQPLITLTLAGSVAPHISLDTLLALEPLDLSTERA